MEVSHTKKSTRIIMWVIAVVMAGGFVGSYFLIILNNDQAAQEQAQAQQSAQDELTKPTGSVDPTAYTTKAKVSKLKIVDEVKGSGHAVKLGDSVKVHYKGTLAQSGVKFDSSYDRGEPIDLTIAEGSVIEGWVKGIPGMQVGGKRRLIIPSSLGYGSYGSYGIPPDSDLVFEIELLEINPK